MTGTARRNRPAKYGKVQEHDPALKLTESQRRALVWISERDSCGIQRVTYRKLEALGLVTIGDTIHYPALTLTPKGKRLAGKILRSEPRFARWGRKAGA